MKGLRLFKTTCSLPVLSELPGELYCKLLQQHLGSWNFPINQAHTKQSSGLVVVVWLPCCFPIVTLKPR